MSYEIIRPGHQLSVPAGSPINPRQAVTLAGTSVLMAFPVATNNVRPIGLNGAATAGVLLMPSQVDAPGDYLTVYEELNIVKAIACASMGAGAEVGVGTTTGRQAPVVGASGVVKWSTGVALTPAADGDVFALYVKPRQLSGLV